MRYEIDTTKILNQLLHYLWIMILAFSIGATGGFVYTQNIKPDTYTTQLSLVVNSRYEDASGISVAKGIIKTAVGVMRSETFIKDNIIEKGGIDLSVSEIKNMCRFSIEDETLIAYIRVTSTSAEQAYEIASAYFNANFSDVDEKVTGCTISTMDPPMMPNSPNAKTATRTGFISGLVLATVAAVIIVLITMFDTRIKTEDDLATIRGDVPIIGVIPSFNQSSSSYGRYGKYGRYGYGYGYGTPQKSETEKNEADEEGSKE